MKEVTKNFTPKKFTVFPGKIKVGPKCPTFIRGRWTKKNRKKLTNVSFGLTYIHTT